MNYKENEIIHIDNHIDYTLLRTELYYGSTFLNKSLISIFENNKIIQKEVDFVPALIKFVCEIIDNSIDENIRCHGDYANKIDVIIEDNKYVIIEDNGRGIPTKLGTNNVPMFVTALTNVQAGSNFKDDKDNSNKGTYGVGGATAFILSTEGYCEVRCIDNTLGYLKTYNNTRNISFEVLDLKNKKYGTKIKLLPDYSRFEVDNFDNIHQNIIYTYLINQSICYPKIQFTFNGVKIKANSFDDYIKFYSDEAVKFYSDDIIDIAIYPSNEFNFTYFINGLNVCDGGDALNYIIDRINSGFKNSLSKKFSKVTNSHFKNRLGYIVVYKNRKDLKWSSQTKTKCNNSYTKLESPTINWDLITKKIVKETNLIEPVLELFKIQEEFENRKSLENLVKPVKKIRIDKYKPAIIENKYLVVSEGNSAGASILAGTGRDYFGAYPLKGKPLNCLKASIQQIKKNQELKDLLEIMGIDLGKDLSQLKTTYEYLLCAADADLDGFSIITLTMSFFMKYYPEFIQQGRFKVLQTPVIIIYKSGKPFKYFLNLESYNAFCENDKSKYDVKYKKGLASITEQEFEWLFSNGIEPFIETLVWCEETLLRYEDWMGDVVDKRKEYLQDKSFDIFNI